MQKILLADDHSIVRKGLIFHCRTEFGFSDVDETADCAGLMKALKRKDYTHLILDLVLSDGMTLEILPNIRAIYPELQILIFSMQSQEMYGPALQKYGIKHYISKDAPEKETIIKLKAFLDNAKESQPASQDPSHESIFDNLSPRETEVLHYALLGMNNLAIADQLNMRPSTVSTFKNRVFKKTNTTNIFQLQELAAIYKKGPSMGMNISE